ncbi:MAG TPA: hypothetical protein VKB30_10675 [Candidatus Limnocylindrales bacterium]|nr:hypothetical protein [Candidatus Limnocylindrales bacterium]
MDVLIPIALSVLAAVGVIAAITGVESREGFDRDGRVDPLTTFDTRIH